MPRVLSRAALVVATLAVGLGLTAAPAAAAPTSGVNDWSCRPAAGKEPVVMLHGLGAPSGSLIWAVGAPSIAATNRCVFTPTYGVGPLGLGGFRSMRDSSKEVAAYVDQVLAATGASKVSIIGHSEGTTVGSYYLKFDGGAAKVKHFIGISPNYKGTTLYGLNNLVRALDLVVSGPLDAVCAACNEFLPPSPFIADLNRGGVTVAGPTYTNIQSTYETVVVPKSSGFLQEPGVVNITVQDKCWLDFSGHITMAFNPNSLALARWALNGRTGSRPGCIPFFGTF